MVAKNSHLKKIKEKCIEVVLFACALSSILITLAIIITLVKETIPFFEKISFWEFLTASEWTPLFENPRYGILPLLSGTIMTTMIALLIAVPFGLITSIYLSEYCSPRTREFLKPTLELLAAIPTVVYGYFAMLFITPLLQIFFAKFGIELGSFNSLSAGLVMGFMIVPYMSSLSEDAMRAVSVNLREASLAMGASKIQTALFVVMPAAFSGIAAAFILAVSRAFGETMVVSIAAGMQPQLTYSPFQATETLTAYIVQVTMGDLPHGSVGYQTLYVVGLTLFLFTLVFNLLGQYVKHQVSKGTR